MINYDHIVCEFTDCKGISYGKAETLIMAKLKVAAAKQHISLEELLQRLNKMDYDQIQTCCEKNYTFDITSEGKYDNIKRRPTMEKLLAQLNALRQEAGKNPLKGWKKSRAKIKEAIKKLSTEKTLPKETPPQLDDVLTLKQLCELIDKNPKTTRAKLRRLAAKNDLPESNGARWQWDVKHTDRLIALLK